jgi:hypothetical protein
MSIQQKILALEQELSELKTTQDSFPDVKEYSTRWFTYLISKSVNSIANKVNFAFSCGCCSDAVAYAMPYVVDKNGRNIYSDPPQICIGEGSRGTCIRNYNGCNWRNELIQHQINPEIVPMIEQYLKEHKYRDDDESED